MSGWDLAQAAGQSTRTSLRRGGHKTALLQAQTRRKEMKLPTCTDTQPGGVRGKGLPKGVLDLEKWAGRLLTQRTNGTPHFRVGISP